MRQIRRLMALAAACVTIAVAMFISSHIVHGQSAPSIYNPYPPGILPADLNSEIARVQREVKGVESQYLAAWHALPPPVVAGNPPTLQGSGYAAVRILGGLLNYDLNMSPFKNLACSSCHMSYASFSGPIPLVKRTTPILCSAFEWKA